MSAVVSVLLLGLALVAVSTFDGSAKPDVLSDLSGSNPAGLTDDEPPAVITVVSWPAFKFPSRLHKQRGVIGAGMHTALRLSPVRCK
jgi:hypothetical protein